MTKKWGKKEKRIAWIFLAPSLFLITLVAFYPIVTAVWYSLLRKNPIAHISKYIGIANYQSLIQDDRFWNSLFNTFYFTFVSVGAEFFLGLAIALIIHQAFKGRGLVRAAILIPWAIPTVVSAKMWEWIYNSHFGILNFILIKLGIINEGINWLGSPFWAMNAAIAVDVWKTTPFVALLLLAGLQVIPEELYKAAKVDGAGPIKRFWQITLPLLKPAILVALLFRTLDAFRVFDVIYVLTEGGPGNKTETLSIYAYKTLFRELDFGYGSALAIITFLCVMMVSFFYIKILGTKTTTT